MMLCRYVKGFILIVWEVLVNINAHINTAILYSFTGRFEEAKDVLDQRWVLLYVGVYIYAIWDSYRTTVDLNKFSILADREESPMIPFKISTLEINYLSRRSPWVAVSWSALMPGTGHHYVHRPITGFFVLIWWIAFAYLSHFFEAIHYTAVGDFGQAVAVTDPKWILFMPSMLGFCIYDAYVNTVEYNKLFEREQARFLKDQYRDAGFVMPDCSFVKVETVNR